MPNESTAKSIDEYIARYSGEARKALEELRELFRSLLPEATEAISYAIPTFKLRGKNLVHFAAWKKHVGLYPLPQEADSLVEDLKGYKTSKGTVQFPLDRPLPRDLIRRIVEIQVLRLAGKDAK